MTDLDTQLDAAWRVRQAHFLPEIAFAYPLDTALVSLTGAQGSGILSSMSTANCFIMLAAEQGSVEPGDTVTVEPFDALL